MKESQFSQRMSKLAGIATWLAIGLPVLLSFKPSLKYYIWLLVYALFIVIFSFHSTRVLRSFFKKEIVVLLVLTLLAAIAQFTLTDYGLMPILFVLTVVIAAYTLAIRQGFYWAIFQSIIIFISLMSIGANLFNSFITAIAYFGFQAFALFSTYALINEAKAKLELAQANAELRATQELIKESGQINERLRISRELHDVIGHQLTALSLNLEVAKHLADGKLKEYITTAQSLNKNLLTDLREVVSSMRDSQEIDLERVLNGLIENVPSPKIHLEISQDLAISDPNRVHLLVRLIQELITNAIKHSEAKNLWISIELNNYQIKIKARDDGRGALNLKAGNGLTGMAERLADLGGKLKFWSELGSGFNLEASLPVGY